MTHITIEVYDQFGDLLHPIYDGCSVDEIFTNVLRISYGDPAPPFSTSGTIGECHNNLGVREPILNGTIIDCSFAAFGGDDLYTASEAFAWKSSSNHVSLSGFLHGITIQNQAVKIDSWLVTPAYKRTRTAIPDYTWTTRDNAL